MLRSTVESLLGCDPNEEKGRRNRKNGKKEGKRERAEQDQRGVFPLGAFLSFSFIKCLLTIIIKSTRVTDFIVKCTKSKNRNN